MAYKNAGDPDFMKDIQSRREYVSLMLDKETLQKPNITYFENTDDPEMAELQKIVSELMVKTSNQLFIGNLMNPNTKIKRVLLKWSTGIGKTIGALLVAVFMEKIYNQIQEATGITYDKLPNIFVIGHTRERVIDDLLKFPEFGFVSPQEFEKQKELNNRALSGTAQDISAAKDHYIMLKRRVTNKQRGGYFRFFGYQELVNRIFGISKDDTSTSDLIAAAYKKDPEEMRKAINDLQQAGKITINKMLLAEFKNSLLVVDELQNTYNSAGVNSWGSTLFYVIDNTENLRVIYMSATPATNKVTEYNVVMNFLSESMERLDLNQPVLPAEIKKRMTGRVSYLQDSDIRAYPKRIFVGEEFKDIEYLKFIICPMSKLQKQAFADFYKEKTADDEEKDKDDYYIRDVAFPNPDPDGPPLFRAKETKQKIMSAPDEWQNKYKLKVDNGHIVGEYAKKENIGAYSSKYEKLIKNILKMPGNEKIVLFHNFVKMSGVYMLAELLRQNGYIDTESTYGDDTICAVCNRVYKNGKHEKIRKSSADSAEPVETSSQPDEQNIDFINTTDTEEDYLAGKINPNQLHQFYPSRFGIVQGEQQQYVNHRIFKVYNDRSNIYGIHMRVLIGAQMIRESVDLKAVRHFEIMSMPINIPTFIQIIGRGIRKGSHDGLPPKDKTCEISIYVAYDDEDKYNLELDLYKRKIKDYKEIQEIEKYVHACAVDAAIHRDIIMSADVLEQYGDLSNPKNILGTLYYVPDYDSISKNPTEISYYAYNMQQQEIHVLMLLIRRLFYIEPIWTFERLKETIHNPPFRTEIDPKSMTEDNIIIALNNLIISMDKKESGKWAIAKYGQYYIKMPKIQNSIGALIIGTPDSYIYGSGIKPIINIPIKEIYNKDIIISNGIISFVKKIKQLSGERRQEKLKNYFDILADTDIEVIDTATRLFVEKGKNKEIEDFLVSLNLLIREKDVPKDVFKSASADYIGYLSPAGPTIYIDHQWKKLSNTSAEIKKINADEQPPVIGYIEDMVDGRIVFKIRRTIKDIEKTIRENKITDARLFERGAVCSTRPKDELDDVVKTLMRRYGNYFDTTNKSIKDYCSFIRQSLMMADAFITGGKYRTFYWFHEKVPFIDRPQ